jgi:hypothetical protein
MDWKGFGETPTATPTTSEATHAALLNVKVRVVSTCLVPT